MNYLLDTHALIWSLLDPEKLSENARQIIEDPKNSISVSAVNFWEISLKYSIGKLGLEGILPHEFPEFTAKTGFDLISLSPQETSTYHNLQGDWHKDPFDRMLIWQAIHQDLVLITKDESIWKYKEIGLKTIWW
ncbi:MAG: type II toxin-antitoxin system VapC family toxin [Gracilimonas sp.]